MTTLSVSLSAGAITSRETQMETHYSITAVQASTIRDEDNHRSIRR